jgi:glycosyltransferase involved in cell wall biosynthesis
VLQIRVVIPAWNAARWIGDAVRSVLAQTHRHWELVVVDDGSTDETADVVAGIADERIRLIRQANAGVSAARNAGVALVPKTSAAAECYLFLDADDRLAPEALERLAAALDAAPDAVAAVGPCQFTDTGAILRSQSGNLLSRLLVRNLFANGGHLLLRSDTVHHTGGFLTGIVYGEDWEFWVRIALQGRFAAVHGRSPVLFVRQHAAGAYQRLAADPASFTPCMDAIFGNPSLVARLGAHRLATIRRCAEAENAWIIGRELIRHERGADGRARLRCAVAARPTIRRAVLLAAAHILPLLPSGLHGPLRPYDR